jgi:hexosaminidase
MKKEGLKDEHELQSYFIKRIEKFINSQGKRIIGWDEILEGGLAPDATVMSWRGTEGGIAAAKENHDVIMTPGTHCYFDYYQADPATEPLAIGGFVTLEKVYSYEPTPEVLTPEQAKHILGAQGNIWTEYMKTTEYVEYMAYPRAIALSEVLWSPKSARNYDDFVGRLQEHFKRLDGLKVNYAKRLYDVKQEVKLENNTPSVELTTVLKNAEIRYTTDGKEPTAASSLYTKPLSVKGETPIKAAVFQKGRMIGKPTVQRYFMHSAAGMAYQLITPPKNTYESGERGLTNGLRGSDKSYAQWTGFNGNDMEAILDFGKERTFSSVRVQFYNRPVSWIFLPDNVIFSVSNDGLEWQDVSRVDYAFSRTDKLEIREAKMTFSEFTKPKRFIKIYAKNVGKCPKGSPCEGNDAWLFADEIIVD